MKYYPAFLNLRERPCVVVGGGPVAERKALALLEAGAYVTVVSPTLTQKLTTLAASGKILHHAQLFEERYLDGSFLAIAATSDTGVNRSVAQLCRKKGILVNVASPPEESSFIVPSVVDRGDLLIAVSTSGASPALSRGIRLELEKHYGPEYELFLVRLAALRKRLQEEVGDEDDRKRILEKIISSNALGLLQQGKLHEAERLISDISRLKTTL